MLGIVFGAWQAKPERRAFADRALHADLSAVALDDNVADVESQAEPDPLIVTQLRIACWEAKRQGRLQRVESGELRTIQPC